jgi:hypothetical protein
LVSTTSFITSLHNRQWSSGGSSPTEHVDGTPSISFSKAALFFSNNRYNQFSRQNIDTLYIKEKILTVSAYLFDFKTATAPLDNAYGPSGGFTLLMSNFGSPFVGQC